MKNSKLSRLSVLIVVGLVAMTTQALASDQPMADGDIALAGPEATPFNEGTNEPIAWGDVCPGRQYVKSVALAVKRTSPALANSFKEHLSDPDVNEVTWGFFNRDATQSESTSVNNPDPDGAHELIDATGDLSARYTGATAVNLPNGWRTAGTGLSSVVWAEVTLSVPGNAPVGDPNPAGPDGTVRWRANGARTAPASGFPTDGSISASHYNRPMGNFWNVLDGDDPSCDQAASATAAFTASHVACGTTANLLVTPSDSDVSITSEDGLTLDIDWGAGFDSADVHVEGVKGNTPLTYPAPYTLAGTHTATVTWTDPRLGAGSTTGSTTASVVVDYDSSGILQPINGDGSSIFKSNSTIPIKVRFTDCDGSVPSGLAPTVRFVRTSGTPPLTGNEETPLSTSAHTDGVLRFSDGQWVYNLAGKSLPDPSATYHLIVTVPSTGQKVEADFGLKA